MDEAIADTGPTSDDRVRVLVLGAGGFLGANILLQLQQDISALALGQARGPLHTGGADYIASSDLLQTETLTEVFDWAQPDVIVNCVALADVDACEREPELAREVNTLLPERIAALCSVREAELIHISTDAVFGRTAELRTTNDLVDPLNAYGRTKAEAEERVLNACEAAIVVRTNIVGWSPSGRRSLLEFFVNSLENGATTPAYTDVFFRPLATSGMWEILRSLLNAKTSGVVHAVGDTLLSKYEFGVKVAQTFGLNEDLLLESRISDAMPEAERPLVMNLEPSSLLNGVCPEMLSVDEGLSRLKSQHEMREQLRRLRVG